MPDTTPAELLAQLTDAQKVSLTAGADAWSTVAVERLGIPAIRLGDGPHGVRKPHDGSGMSLFDSHPATCFPTAAALGSTWDQALVREVGEALGREAAAHGIAVLLGPGVNLKRTPVGGRNFEYFSEDPHLSSQMGAAWVRGVQSTGVGASLKHFAANNTEQRRYGIDAVVDERALRELYLASFESVVIDERPATVMAAYNQLNGSHCTENGWLLQRILREEWGFEGVVVSDWGAAWDRRLSIPAGNDLAMPGLGARDDRYVLAALRSGTLSRKALEASAARILALVERHSGAATEPVDQPDLDAHHLLARRAAAAGTVLLKNDNETLPLRSGSRVALIGVFASEPRFQGAGSSHVVPTRVDTLLGALTSALGADAVTFAPGYDLVHNESTPAQIAAAHAAARGADVAVVVIGLPEVFETEGIDRSHLRLPASHDRLVEAVVAANPNTVVVLQNGSPVELPWRDAVPAIVEGYLGGQASGSAMAEVLLGVAEPGGRLAETFPVAYASHPVSRLPNGPATAEYRESLYVGYRYFDSVGAEVAFPFGHGLSYTSFAWSDVAVSVVGDGDGDGALVQLVVTNTGSRAGSDVVQVYVHDVSSSVYRPEQELRGFAKVSLEPGAAAAVSIRLPRRAFSFWNAASQTWVLEAGRFEIRVARSSRDIRWQGSVDLSGDAGALLGGDGPAEPVAYRTPSPSTGFPAADFERLLGHPLPPNIAARPGAFTLDTAVRDMQGTVAGRLLQRYLARQAVKTIGAPASAPVDAVAGEVVAQLTFRMFPTVSEAAVGRRGALRLLALVNRLARIRPRRRRSSAAGAREH
ncbi:glycoside hydrolase family 3 C-terminal domain-containing protein [Herbiconiux sp. P17]|uniref:glycoside hydrolase family 3 C-terminal domain-containing protein n=1 Tax=Herbiconiux wuyangfengii TaxID=3342794 RepID=UPI0035B80E4E